MKLMDQVRQVLPVRQISIATEQCYCQWIRRFIYSHGVKHPNTMAAEEVERLLTHLGHNDGSTTIIYTHVMEKAAARVRSPLDGMMA